MKLFSSTKRINVPNFTAKHNNWVKWNGVLPGTRVLKLKFVKKA